MAHFRGVITLESGVKSLSACRSAAQKLVNTTIFKGLTFESIPVIIKTY
jgi:NADH:ubiquinone oxidoreductase subunit E